LDYAVAVIGSWSAVNFFSFWELSAAYNRWFQLRTRLLEGAQFGTEDISVKLYVGSLSFATTEHDLQDLFTQVGTVMMAAAPRTVTALNWANRFLAASLGRRCLPR